MVAEVAKGQGKVAAALVVAGPEVVMAAARAEEARGEARGGH